MPSSLASGPSELYFERYGLEVNAKAIADRLVRSMDRFGVLGLE